MRIEFTGRQTQVPPEIRKLAERKLEKLARVLPRITRAHVTVHADKHRQIAEVSVHSKHLELTAQEASSDLGASLSTVIDRLTRQAQRQVGKRRTRKRGGVERERRRGRGEERGGEPGPRVIRSRGFPVKPMTLDEAALQLGSTAEGFLVFRDAATERVSVLYVRKDGNLGHIEPEA
jgi:putative sigma-54 modulation protein